MVKLGKCVLLLENLLRDANPFYNKNYEMESFAISVECLWDEIKDLSARSEVWKPKIRLNFCQKL